LRKLGKGIYTISKNNIHKKDLKREFDYLEGLENATNINFEEIKKACRLLEETIASGIEEQTIDLINFLIALKIVYENSKDSLEKYQNLSSKEKLLICKIVEVFTSKEYE